MKAYRNLNGKVIEIEVDIGLDNKPILPPDTTTDEPPTPLNGHYITVVNDKWAQIPIPQEYIAFETKKQNKLERLKTYKEWYFKQPIEHDGLTFDADDTARERLTQAIVVNSVSGYLPPFWITKNNTVYTIDNLDKLKALVNAVQNTFTTRFYQVTSIRNQILAANDENTLNSIEVPSIPLHF